MNEYILQTNALSKHYGKFAAVSNVSLHIRKGAIYGLVGRNGAGKTTFMKMICSLAAPTQGSFTLCGETYPKLSAARTKIGNLIEAPGIYPHMSAYDNLKAQAMLFGCDNPETIKQILDIIGLSKVGRKHAGKFSLGMRQRLGIGLALIGNPELLVLDEPINGLDPAGVAEIRETLLRLNQEQGITILISSHILGELSKLCTDYGFLDRGELIREITQEELNAECTESIFLQTNDTDAAVSVLRRIGITQMTKEENGVLRLTDGMDRTADITEALVKCGIRIYEIAKQGTDLEGYYLNMIGGKEKAS